MPGGVVYISGVTTVKKKCFELHASCLMNLSVHITQGFQVRGCYTTQSQQEWWFHRSSVWLSEETSYETYFIFCASFSRYDKYSRYLKHCEQILPCRAFIMCNGKWHENWISSPNTCTFRCICRIYNDTYVYDTDVRHYIPFIAKYKPEAYTAIARLPPVVENLENMSITMQISLTLFRFQVFFNDLVLKHSQNNIINSLVSATLASQLFFIGFLIVSILKDLSQNASSS